MKKDNKFEIIQFPEGQPEPLFVAARDVPKVIVGLSAKTLANWRSLKIGPAYHLVQGTPYYNWQELKLFFSAGRVDTFNGGNL